MPWSPHPNTAAQRRVSRRNLAHLLSGYSSDDGDSVHALEANASAEIKLASSLAGLVPSSPPSLVTNDVPEEDLLNEGLASAENPSTTEFHQKGGARLL